MNKVMKKKIVIFLSLLLAAVNFAGLGFGINVKAAEVNYEYKSICSIVAFNIHYMWSVFVWISS